jgi:23S rRNA (guanosine2251-2'-O)-methyltransferase
MRKLKLEELGRKSVEEFKLAPKNPVVVVLDNVRSMHNVGAVFRNCDAFLVERLVLCGYTPRPPHREITKTAIGAEESVNWVHHADILDAIQMLRSEGYRIACAEQTSASLPLPLFSPKSDEKWAFVFGNEVLGVNPEVVGMVDLALEIPQAGTKHSLNVAVASGIVLYAAVNALT